MTSLQKVAMGVIAIGFVTTLVYPQHQTQALFSGLTDLSTGTLSTAEGLK